MLDRRRCKLVCADLDKKLFVIRGMLESKDLDPKTILEHLSVMEWGINAIKDECETLIIRNKLEEGDECDN